MIKLIVVFILNLYNNYHNLLFIKIFVIIKYNLKRKAILTMYICPECNREFKEEEKLVKHYLRCWKEKNPFHVSKDAPRGEDIETRKINNDIENFFNSFN